MTVFHLSFRVPYSAHRDCMIVIRPRGAAYQALCVDAATRSAIGCPSIPRGPGGSRPEISADDVIRLMGGTYRLASVAMDLDVDELARRTRRVSNRLEFHSRRASRAKGSFATSGRIKPPTYPAAARRCPAAG